MTNNPELLKELKNKIKNTPDYIIETSMKSLNNKTEQENAIAQLENIKDSIDWDCKENIEFRNSIDIVLSILEEKDKLIEKQERQLYERNNRVKNLEKECQKYFDNMMDTICEMYNKDRSVELILNRLENDTNRITDKKAEGYTDDYRRCRLKAYRTKTREIKELIEKQYLFGDVYERGE